MTMRTTVSKIQASKGANGCWQQFIRLPREPKQHVDNDNEQHDTLNVTRGKCTKKRLRKSAYKTRSAHTDRQTETKKNKETNAQHTKKK